MAAFVRASKTDGLVTSARFNWREDFPGVSLNAENWRVEGVGSGHSIAVASSELQILTGVTANTETVLWSLPSMSPPFRVAFIFRLSQRIVNQEFFLEVVTANGTMLAQWLFDGAVATTGRVTVANAGVVATPTAVTIPTTATLAIAEIEMLPDEVYFHNRLVDSGGVRTQTSVRTRLIPSPGELYFIRIRARNLAVAPASGTTLFVDAITVHDVAQLSAEIIAGRGQFVGSQAIATQSVGGVITSIGALPTLGTLTTMTTGNIQSIQAQFIDSTTALAAGASFIGTIRDLTATPRRNRIIARAFADQPGTLFIEQSRDAVAGNMRFPVGHSISLAAGECRELIVNAVARGWRVRYVNGATLQGAFELISAEYGL